MFRNKGLTVLLRYLDSLSTTRILDMDALEMSGFSGVRLWYLKVSSKYMINKLKTTLVRKVIWIIMVVSVMNHHVQKG